MLRKSVDNVCQENRDAVYLKNIFSEFDKPVQITSAETEKFKEYTISQWINNQINNTLEDISEHVIKSNTENLDKKNIKEIVLFLEKFFRRLGFGTFEFAQKSGKNIFKVKHSADVNIATFLTKLFEKLFQTHLRNYSYHIISGHESSCVLFR